MKQLLIILMAGLVFSTGICLTGEVTADKLDFTYMTVSDADDSLTNADTGYITKQLTAGRYDMLFEITVTKVSGTVAGNIILQGSNDNSTWFNLASTNQTDGFDAGITNFVEDTATLTNATNTYRWLIGGSTAWRFAYYRARVITTGTSVVALDATRPVIWMRERKS